MRSKDTDSRKRGLAGYPVAPHTSNPNRSIDDMPSTTDSPQRSARRRRKGPLDRYLELEALNKEIDRGPKKDQSFLEHLLGIE